jgi:hypothetical protein
MRFVNLRTVAIASVACASLLAACGGSSGGSANSSPTTVSSSPTTAPSSPTTATGHLDKKATNTPSVSAKMICEPEAAKDIYDQDTGVHTIKAFQPTWVDHVYSCDYVYPGGAVMRLSVKEMSSPEETTAYFDSLAQKLGKAAQQPPLGFGQGAFVTKNGDLVVRKDYKVLLVDISKLPASFGVPPDTRQDVAINVGATIMGCWTGA